MDTVQLITIGDIEGIQIYLLVRLATPVAIEW